MKPFCLDKKSSSISYFPFELFKTPYGVMTQGLSRAIYSRFLGYNTNENEVMGEVKQVITDIAPLIETIISDNNLKPFELENKLRTLVKCLKPTLIGLKNLKITYKGRVEVEKKIEDYIQSIQELIRDPFPTIFAIESQSEQIANLLKDLSAGNLATIRDLKKHILLNEQKDLKLLKSVLFTAYKDMILSPVLYHDLAAYFPPETKDEILMSNAARQAGVKHQVSRAINQVNRAINLDSKENISKFIQKNAKFLGISNTEMKRIVLKNSIQNEVDPETIQEWKVEIRNQDLTDTLFAKYDEISVDTLIDHLKKNPTTLNSVEHYIHLYNIQNKQNSRDQKTELANFMKQVSKNFYSNELRRNYGLIKEKIPPEEFSGAIQAFFVNYNSKDPIEIDSIKRHEAIIKLIQEEQNTLKAIKETSDPSLLNSLKSVTIKRMITKEKNVLDIDYMDKALQKLKNVETREQEWIEDLKKGIDNTFSYYHATNSHDQILSNGIDVRGSNRRGPSGGMQHRGAFVSNRPEFQYGNVCFALNENIQFETKAKNTYFSKDPKPIVWLGFNKKINLHPQLKNHEKASKNIFLNCIFQRIQAHALNNLSESELETIRKAISRQLDTHLISLYNRQTKGFIPAWIDSWNSGKVEDARALSEMKDQTDIAARISLFIREMQIIFNSFPNIQAVFNFSLNNIGEEINDKLQKIEIKNEETYLKAVLVLDHDDEKLFMSEVSAPDYTTEDQLICEYHHNTTTIDEKGRIFQELKSKRPNEEDVRKSMSELKIKNIPILSVTEAKIHSDFALLGSVYYPNKFKSFF